MINKVKENPNFLKSSIKMNAIMNETELVVKPETTKKLVEHATPSSLKTITLRTQKTHKIMSDMNCQSRNNIAYVITLEML